MPRIVIFILEFNSALQHLKHCCHIIGTIGTEHSVSASDHCNSHVHGYGKKAYILKSGCNFSFQCNKLKKKFLFKQERDSYSSFNRASFVTFVTAKVTI